MSMVADLDTYKLPSPEQLKKMFGIKPGDVVKLKPGTVECRVDGVTNTTTATVLGTYGEGCCQLNSPLGGCRYWNEMELEKIH